ASTPTCRGRWRSTARTRRTCTTRPSSTSSSGTSSAWRCCSGSTGASRSGGRGCSRCTCPGTRRSARTRRRCGSTRRAISGGSGSTSGSRSCASSRRRHSSSGGSSCAAGSPGRRGLFPEEEAELAELEPEEAAEELARRLAEYRRMKEAAAWLADRLASEGDRYFRLGPAPLAPKPERRLADQDPAQLAEVIRL